MIVSVTLARGAVAHGRAQGRRQAPARDPEHGQHGRAVHLDKTGTCSPRRCIRLERHIDAEGREDCPRVLQLAWLNSHFESGVRRSRSTTRSLRRRASTPRVGRRSTRSRSVSSAGVSRCSLSRRGAPRWWSRARREDTLALCTECESAGPEGQVVTTPFWWRRQGGRRGAVRGAEPGRGFRVLAVAWRAAFLPSQDHARVDDGCELVFCGALPFFLDPPKAGAAQALAHQLRALHVHVAKVVTGDNEGVTRHVRAGRPSRPPPAHRRARSTSSTTRRSPCRPRRHRSSAGSLAGPEESRVLRALKSRGHVVG